jgi:hypothetical protein
MSPRKSDSQVYKNIHRYDPGVADRWWGVTERAGRPGDVKVSITAANLQEIVGDLTSIVTPGRAGAIDQLMTWHDNFTGDALDLLKDKAASAFNNGAIWRGASHLLNGQSSGALPDNIIDALRYTAKINFISPMSNFHYMPMHYTAVIELIRRRLIYLYEVEDHGLTLRARGPAAYYDKSNDPRALVLFQKRYGQSGTERTFLHECTHAIQDWAKVPRLIEKHAEADAHVCGWIVGRGTGEKAMEILDEDIAVTAFELADFVIKKRDVSDRGKFAELYKKLVGFIEVHPSYSAEANKDAEYPDPEDTDQKKYLRACS